jgi:hypothetical protein
MLVGEGRHRRQTVSVGALAGGQAGRRDGRPLPARTRPSPASVRSSRTGMRFDPLTTVDVWKAIGARVAMYSEASSWWLGDWLAFGQVKYGRRYKEGVAVTGLDYGTLRNYATVARRFELSRRRDDVSFQHHAEVCALADGEQDRWLELAAANRWSKTELRRRLRAALVGETGDERIGSLRIALEPAREAVWRAAARRSDCALETWVTQVVDAAARSEPGPRSFGAGPLT